MAKQLSRANFRPFVHKTDQRLENNFESILCEEIVTTVGEHTSTAASLYPLCNLKTIFLPSFIHKGTSQCLIQKQHLSLALAKLQIIETTDRAFALQLSLRNDTITCL
jgi:hypothetical protein